MFEQPRRDALLADLERRARFDPKWRATTVAEAVRTIFKAIATTYLLIAVPMVSTFTGIGNHRLGLF